jgi:hypothetical protein
MLQAGRSPVRVPTEVDIFNLPNPSSRTMALGSTQPLTEMSTRNLPGGKKRPARRLANLPPSVSRMSENVGASTSRNPKGLHGLYRDNFTLSLTHGAEPFLGRCQLCSYSRSSQHFKEPEGSLPCSQEPSTGPYREPDQSNPYHPVISF